MISLNYHMKVVYEKCPRVFLESFKYMLIPITLVSLGNSKLRDEKLVDVNTSEGLFILLALPCSGI